MKFILFGKKEYDYFCEQCMLNKDYKKLLEMKILDYKRPKMAKELNVSIDTLDDMIAILKEKIKKVL